MNLICLMDTAFSFFQNYPCRLAHIEIECDLPCEELIFHSTHPFAEPNFHFTRNLTVSEAFQSLFEEHPSSHFPPSKHSGNPLGFTVFDMFILIHRTYPLSPLKYIMILTPGLVVYSFINSHMALLVPILRKSQNGESTQASTPGSGRSLIPDDSILAEIRTALSRWRDHWEALHSQVSENQWASMGFYKNGYNFWLVSQLLITKKASVDVVMQMEVNCEDKLEKLNVLLMDE